MCRLPFYPLKKRVKFVKITNRGEEERYAGEKFFGYLYEI